MMIRVNGVIWRNVVYIGRIKVVVVTIMIIVLKPGSDRPVGPVEL